MSSNYYDPECAPNAAEWLALSEAERQRVVKSFHFSERIKTADKKLHAVEHLTVEDQIATGFGPSRRAVTRLQEQGLSRHEAVREIAAIAWKCFRCNQWGVEAIPVKIMQARMNDEINALAAANFTFLAGWALLAILD